MKQFKFYIIVFFISSLFSSCVSQLFKEPKPTFSKEIILPVLSDDYIKLENNVYPAWKNKNSSVVISIISDCSENQTSLKSIHSLMIDSIDNAKILKENKTQLARLGKAHFRTISGEIDSKAVQIQSYSFQHKKCFYLTSLAGSPEKLKTYEKDFLNFINGIKFEK